MTGGSSNGKATGYNVRVRRHHVRPPNAHLGRSGSGGDGVGLEHLGDDAQQDGGAHPGDVRSRIAELRRTAELVRAFEPTTTGRSILDLALITGWPPSEIAGLTFSQTHYLTRTMMERNRGARR